MNENHHGFDKNLAAALRQSAITDEGRIHVISRNLGWALKREGNLRATRIFDTQAEAVEVAKSYLRARKTDKVVVHRRDGSVDKVYPRRSL